MALTASTPTLCSVELLQTWTSFQDLDNLEAESGNLDDFWTRPNTVAMRRIRNLGYDPANCTNPEVLEEWACCYVLPRLLLAQAQRGTGDVNMEVAKLYMERIEPEKWKEASGELEFDKTGDGVADTRIASQVEVRNPAPQKIYPWMSDVTLPDGVWNPTDAD